MSLLQGIVYSREVAKVTIGGISDGEDIVKVKEGQIYNIVKDGQKTEKIEKNLLFSLNIFYFLIILYDFVSK